MTLAEESNECRSRKPCVIKPIWGNSAAHVFAPAAFENEGRALYIKPLGGGWVLLQRRKGGIISGESKKSTGT